MVYDRHEYVMTHTPAITLFGALSTLFLVLLSVYTVSNFHRKGSQFLGIHFGLWAMATAIFLFGTVGHHVEIINQYSDQLDTVSLLFFISTFTAAQFSWLTFVLYYTTEVQQREILFVGVFAVISTIANVVPRIQDGAYVPDWFVIDLISSGGLFVWVVSVIGIPVYGLIQLIKLSQHQRGLTQNSAFLLGIPPMGLALAFLLSGTSNIPRLYSFSVIGFVAFFCGLIAISSYGVLEQHPVSNVVGRDTAINVLDTGIIVLDDENRISDANPAAEQLLEPFGSTSVIGEKLTDVIPETVDREDLLSTGRIVFEDPKNNRVFRAETATATDKGGRDLGHVISLHDITEERRRQQRIQVLNRVLRHNLRNDLNAVDGYIDLLKNNDSKSADYAGRIQRRVSDLMSIGEKAREIEEVIATEEVDDSVRIGTLIDEVVKKVQQDYSDVDISIERSDSNPEVDGFVLSSVLQELIENACRHNQSDHPSVNISTEMDNEMAYDIIIEISDNGPGIPEQELTPIRNGSETALEHGSGLGLWLVKWGIERLEGDVKFDENNSEGTVVTLYI